MVRQSCDTRTRSSAAGKFENFRIAESVHSSLLSGRKVDGRLVPPNRPDDCKPEIVVCLEAQAQTRDSPGFAGEAAARAF